MPGCVIVIDKTGGSFGAISSSQGLQIGQGMPAPPQAQAWMPVHGRSGRFSQNQSSPSQRQSDPSSLTGEEHYISS
jgi:hypothetical protein